MVHNFPIFTNKAQLSTIYNNLLSVGKILNVAVFQAGSEYFFKKSYIRQGKCRPATTTPTPSRSGYPPLDSETGWTGELWLYRVLLIFLQNKYLKKYIFLNKVIF